MICSGAGKAHDPRRERGAVDDRRSSFDVRPPVASTVSTGSNGLSSSITVTPAACALPTAPARAAGSEGAMRMPAAPATTRLSIASAWIALSPSYLPAKPRGSPAHRRLAAAPASCPRRSCRRRSPVPGPTEPRRAEPRWWPAPRPGQAPARTRPGAPRSGPRSPLRSRESPRMASSWAPGWREVAAGGGGAAPAAALPSAPSGRPTRSRVPRKGNYIRECHNS